MNCAWLIRWRKMLNGEKVKRNNEENGKERMGG